jgi:hypothetical protein
MRLAGQYFQVGGVLDDEAPSYVARPADERLLAALELPAFCIVEAPRQAGKSSLIIRAQAELLREGVRVGIADLSILRGQSDPTLWIGDVVLQLAETLGLEVDDVARWWQESSRPGADHEPGAARRFARFLREKVLTMPGKVVLFFDEIEPALELPCSDLFFSELLKAHEGGPVVPVADETELAVKPSGSDLSSGELPGCRLGVVVLGTVLPAVLRPGSDRARVAKWIRLDDFTRWELRAFEGVLGPDGKRLVDRIAYWTDGHPLLVQRIAAITFAWGERGTPASIDQEVSRGLLDNRVSNDPLVKQAENSFRDGTRNLWRVLRIYRLILFKVKVSDDDWSAEKVRLKSSGIVKVRGGRLVPRNRIFERRFNLRWASRNLLRPIAASVALGSSVLLLLLLFVVWLSRIPTVDVGGTSGQGATVDVGGTSRQEPTLDRGARALQSLGGMGAEIERGVGGAYKISLRKVAKKDLSRAMDLLGRVDKLAWLDLHGLGVSDGQLASLEAVPGLKTLDLGVNGDVTDAGLRHLRRLSMLEELSLEGLKTVSPAGLRNLAQLSELRLLDLSGTGVKGSQLGVLSNLKKLETLLVADEQLKGEGESKSDPIMAPEGLRQLAVSGRSPPPWLSARIEHLSGLRRVIYSGDQPHEIAPRVVRWGGSSEPMTLPVESPPGLCVYLHATAVEGLTRAYFEDPSVGAACIVAGLGNPSNPNDIARVTINTRPGAAKDFVQFREAIVQKLKSSSVTDLYGFLVPKPDPAQVSVAITDEGKLVWTIKNATFDVANAVLNREPAFFRVQATEAIITVSLRGQTSRSSILVTTELQGEIRGFRLDERGESKSLVPADVPFSRPSARKVDKASATSIIEACMIEALKAFAIDALKALDANWAMAVEAITQEAITTIVRLSFSEQRTPLSLIKIPRYQLTSITPGDSPAWFILALALD